jgi:hypothetical protein
VDGSVGSLGLWGGETVFPGSFADQIPPVLFDEVIDGVAVSVADRAGLRRSGYVTDGVVVACGAVAAAGLFVVGVAGLPAVWGLTKARGPVAFLGLIGVLAFGCGLGRRAFAVLSVVIGVAAAALAALMVRQVGSPGTGLSLGGPPIMCASSAALVRASISVPLVAGLAGEDQDGGPADQAGASAARASRTLLTGLTVA